MSDFVPMGEAELEEVMAGKWVPHLGDVIATALRYLAERDAVTVERDQLRSDLEGEQKSRRKFDAEIRAILHIASDVSVLPVLRERLTGWGAVSRAKKAAEEARDLAIVERDEAYRQRDEAFARADDGRHEVQRVYGALRGRLASRLNVSISEPDEAIIDAVDARAGMKRERDAERGIRLEREAVLAEVRAEVSRLQSDRDAERGLRLALESQINDTRAILGAAPDELLSDAVRKIRDTLNPPAGTSVLQAADWYRREVEVLRGAYMPEAGRVREMLGLAAGDSIQDRVRLLLDAAEAEPPQVFRIIPRVTVDRGAVRFDVVTTDPGIRALTADQLSRLGLVVCDE